MSIPATSEYTLGGKDVDLTNMVGVIKTPGGGTEPCLLKKMPDGKLGKFMLSITLKLFNAARRISTGL